MNKIKKLLTRKSLKTSFIQYVMICIISALLFSLMLSSACQNGQQIITVKYQRENTEYWDDTGKFSIHIERIADVFTPADYALHEILGVISIGVFPFCFILSIIITSFLFYKRRLQEPLKILNHAADNISVQNLAFKITYDKQDELGKLCFSFEKMRAALYDNNLEMWRQIEERRRLNAAFAHDLRTPLTVLKGQSEMLRKYAPKMSEKKILETAEMMQRHISRLENYVNTMRDLQRLEDIEIQKQPIALNALIQQMELTGASLCSTKKFLFSEKPEGMLNTNLDSSVILQVYENILGNAIRYAENTITVSASKQGDAFYIRIADDGRGFTAKDLANASKPFYKAAENTDHEHFGMGLNICKILCEKHGGALKLENHNGAVVTAVFRQ